MHRKIKIRRPAALLLAFCLCLALFGCGKSSEETGYRVLETIDSGDYAVAFRAGDTGLRDYVDAAVKVLAAAGNVHEIALRWFTSDPTGIEGDRDALTALYAGLELEAAPARELIMGIDPDARPLSYADAGGDYQGFDVELARAVCAILGWTLKIQPIDPGDVEIELKSGNIDCAWGGMCFDPAGEGYCLSQGYMPCEYKLVTKLDGGVGSKSRLAGEALGLVASSGALAALKNQSFYEKLSETVSYAGVSDCFAGLASGRCAAIFVDAYAAAYYL